MTKPRRRGRWYVEVDDVEVVRHRLNTPPPRRRDWMGCTMKSAMPSPTESPIDTEMSCSAVWKPDR